MKLEFKNVPVTVNAVEMARFFDIAIAGLQAMQRTRLPKDAQSMAAAMIGDLRANYEQFRAAEERGPEPEPERQSLDRSKADRILLLAFAEHHDIPAERVNDFLYARAMTEVEEPSDRCSNPGGHKYEIQECGGFREGRCLCIYCGADGDA